MANITIPDNAPFNAEQRQWLGDFLSKAFAQNATAAVVGDPVPITILVGSQTGNTEALGKKLSKKLSKSNFIPNVVDMASYEVGNLASEKHVLVMTSTYGDGEAPDNANDLHTWIRSEAATSLAGVKFSVFGMGDSEYPDFNQCAKEFQEAFIKLGAEQITDPVYCDVEYDDDYKSWETSIINILGAAAPSVADDEEEEDGFTKKNPFGADITKNFNLNDLSSARETHHVEFSLEGSDLAYEAGDALGVYPQNDEQLVDEILKNLPFNTNTEVPAAIGKGEVSFREALLSHYDITSLNKGLVEKWSARSGSPYLRSLVESGSKEALDDFMWGRGLVDLVCDHPADYGDAEELLEDLKKLQPRLYSISSSPKAHPGEVHLTVGVVRYDSHGRKRGGVCSTYLSDRFEGKQTRVFMHSNTAFRPPVDDSVPMIMCGPGTGVAPFRAFLEEREARGAKGQNWMFFGNPHEKLDYLYQEDFTQWQNNGLLEKMSLAWSRDGQEKVYVQNLMLQEGAQFFEWLQKGAHFYVCGDASRMAKDVDKALHQILEEHGKMSQEEAEAYVKQMKKDKRYARDVY